MTPDAERRWRCSECRWIGRQSELLSAESPFEPGDIIYGCPACKSVDTFEEVCDEPGCKQPSSCGFPTSTGYRRTCSDHSDFAEERRRHESAQRSQQAGEVGAGDAAQMDEKGLP